MAIEKMDGFTLLTFHRYKNGLLKELQTFGDAHFRKPRREERDGTGFLLADYAPERVSADEGELESLRFAIAKIEPYVEKPKGLKGLTTPLPAMTFEELDAFSGTFDYKAAVDAVKAQDDRQNAVKSEISKLAAENDNLKVWMKLDVSPKELSGLKNARAVLGTVNKMTADAFRLAVESGFKNVHLEFLGVTKDDMAAFMIIPADSFEDDYTKLKELGFSRSTLAFDDIPSVQIDKNFKKIQSLEKELAAAAETIASFAPLFPKLNIVSDYFKTRLEREKSRENFLKTDSVVVLEGWVPSSQRGRLEKLVERACGADYYLDCVAVDKDDAEVPVKLKNNSFVKAFEDVTTMYAVPKYNEIGPTPLFTPFYWFFFGFMVGDVGFGLLLLFGTLFAIKCCNFKEGMKNFLKFFHLLSYGVIAAGCVYSSFFGFPMPWAPLLDTQADIPLMLVLSIAVGYIHVIFGLLIKGYMLVRDGKVIDAVFDSLFWIITLTGGICWLVGVTGVIPAAVANIGKYCFFGGIIGLALTQGRGAASIGGKIGTSLWEVYGISGYVGDLVSYTRIVALGLSGAFIGFSFIQMSSILPEGPIGAIFGAVIIVLGQTLNIGLGLLGAYVHTCRLQYVEFFGKYFEGGGVPFRPLKVKNDYIQITK